MLFQDMFGKSMELVTFQRNDLSALQADKPPRAARPQFSDIAVLRACAVHCRNFDHGVLLCETVESPINRRLSNVNSFGFETVHTLFRRHKPVAVFFQAIPDQLLLLRSVSDTFCHFSPPVNHCGIRAYSRTAISKTAAVHFEIKNHFQFIISTFSIVSREKTGKCHE